MVSVLANYSDDPSSNPAEVSDFMAHCFLKNIKKLITFFSPTTAKKVVWKAVSVSSPASALN